MSYVDEIESDFSVYHRVDDFWCRPSDWITRFAGKLVAYQGALWLAMQKAEPVDQTPVQPAYLSTGYPQAVDSLESGDTPPEVVAALWQRAIVSDYQEHGFEVDGIEEISSAEMEALFHG